MNIDETKGSYTEQVNPKEVTTLKKNKSCFFILPLLGHPSYWYYELINCFLGDETNKPDYSLSKIFIQVKSYDNKLSSTKYFNQFYRLEDDTYMYIYDIPKQYEDDYIKFYKGQYSEMSNSAKEIICKLSGVKPIMESTVYKVLYKTNDQKLKVEELIGQKLSDKAELYSIPDMDTEIYNSPMRRVGDSEIKEEKVEREINRGREEEVL